MYGVAFSPGAVYTETDFVRGKCPNPGTKSAMVDAQGSKEFIMCKVAASQNLTNGHVVTISRIAGGTGIDWIATVAAANAPGNGLADNRTVGVAVCSITASASTFIWVQVYGRGNVQASLSALPNIPLKIGSVAGNVDDDVTSSLSGYIEGIVLLTTSSTAGIITACFLNYPHYAPTPAA